MHIGILTLPFHTNYGGILQAFALNTVLEEAGHEVTFICINQEIHLKWHRQLVKTLMRIGKKVIFWNKKVDILWEKHHNERIQEQKKYSKHTDLFVQKHLKCQVYSSFAAIRETDFDTFVVGSDQIWRKKYVPRIESSFLDFAQKWNIKRIAYAPSFGTDEWEYNEQETNKCRQLLQLFDFVSVREKEGVELCKKHLNHEAHWVIDPTLLLNMETYIKKTELQSVSKSKGNLLCYIIDMDEEKQKLIDRIATDRHLIPFTVNSRSEDTSKKYSLEDCIQPPVEEWLRGFIDADYVVTDSFHACAFSIIFGKQFIVFGNKSRGLSRFNSLLSQFKLEDRIVTDSSFDNIPSDYNPLEVQNILNYTKGKSHTLLISSL